MALESLPHRLLLAVLAALIFQSPATRGSRAGPAAGDKCRGSYNISEATSVQPSSFQDGAELLGATLVNSSLGCRSLCCSARRCNLALLQGGSPGGLTCHLLDCSGCPQSTCTLTPRPGFEASISISSVTVYKGVDPSDPPPVDCLSPSKTGDCRASFRRWYYDATTKTCKGFIYGGCLANGNNFKSEADCLKNCDGVTAPSNNSVPVSFRTRMNLKDCSKPCSADEFTCDNGCCVSLNLLCDGTTQCFDKSDDKYCSAVRASFALLTEYQQSTAPDDERCHAPKKVGSCRAAFPRWYFDPKTLTCNLFIYGGCRGNKNNYESKDDCTTACDGWKAVIPEPQKLQKDNTEDEAYCFAPAVTGKCRASFPRWYYDPKSQSCKAFTFGGCGGNKNNYESEGECSARCSGKKGNLYPDGSGNFDKQHNPELRHHASAISMVVLLAICVLILLGGVIYFIVKLAKTDHVVSYHRTKSGEDKETLINTVENL